MLAGVGRCGMSLCHYVMLCVRNHYRCLYIRWVINLDACMLSFAGFPCILCTGLSRVVASLWQTVLGHAMLCPHRAGHAACSPSEVNTWATKRGHYTALWYSMKPLCCITTMLLATSLLPFSYCCSYPCSTGGRSDATVKACCC